MKKPTPQPTKQAATAIKAELKFWDRCQTMVRDILQEVSDFEGKQIEAKRPKPHRDDHLQALKMRLVQASNRIIAKQKQLFGLPK